MPGHVLSTRGKAVIKGTKILLGLVFWAERQTKKKVKMYSTSDSGKRVREN